MVEQVIHINLNESQRIVDLYAETESDYIAFTNDNCVVICDHNCRIDVDLMYPIIRRVDESTFLIADSRTEVSANLHIFDFNGRHINSFLAGDGIADILVHQEKIVVSYFDEGVFGDDGPNLDGLSVFDVNGTQLFGFNSSVISEGIADCYSMSKCTPNSIVFYAYDDFNVRMLNLDTLVIKEFVTPKGLRGASAISKEDHVIILHGIYGDKSTLYAWNESKSDVTEIGSYPPPLRGLTGGKFMAFGDKGYTLIDLSDEISSAFS